MGDAHLTSQSSLYPSLSLSLSLSFLKAAEGGQYSESVGVGSHFLAWDGQEPKMLRIRNETCNSCIFEPFSSSGLARGRKCSESMLKHTETNRFESFARCESASRQAQNQFCNCSLKGGQPGFKNI